jgi:predicted enzyme related to lactoylglutathione lyase
MKIAMTGVYVNNPIEAFKFYTETLGFKQHTYMFEMYLAIVVSPEETTGTALLLEPNNNPIAGTYQKALYDAGLPVIVFGVDDVENEYKRLADLGVVFKMPPTKTQWGTQAIFNDTCGNFVQIHQIPK